MSMAERLEESNKPVHIHPLPEETTPGIFLRGIRNAVRRLDPEENSTWHGALFSALLDFSPAELLVASPADPWSLRARLPAQR